MRRSTVRVAWVVVAAIAVVGPAPGHGQTSVERGHTQTSVAPGHARAPVTVDRPKAASGHGQPPGAQHAPSELLDPVTAVQLALARHPSLEAAGAALNGAVAALEEAASARLPSLSLDASLTRYQEPMVVAPLHGFDPMRPPTFDRTLAQGGVTVAYTLWDGGVRGARIERAGATMSATAAELSETRQTLVARTLGAYLRVRTAREVVEAHERRVEALERERDRAEQFFSAGRGARVMVLRAEAALAAARADAHGARAELEVAERELARLIGEAPARVAGLPVAAVSLTAGAPSREQAIDRASRGNMRLQRAEHRIQAATAARSEARGLWRPRLQLVGRYVEYAGGAGREQGEWQGGVMMSYPLFTGGARRAAAERADAELRSAIAAREVARLELESAIDAALARLESELARVDALSAAVARSEEVVRVERLALEAGAGVQSDYLAAEAELLNARAALAAARAAVVTARIELARLTGELEVEWLATNLEWESQT